MDSYQRWPRRNTGAWQEIFPGTDGKVLDIYDPEAMTEPAMARATSTEVCCRAGVPARVDAIPIADGWADAVFLLMTSTSNRAPEEREQFFRELARILSARGKLVVVEHLPRLRECSGVWARRISFSSATRVVAFGIGGRTTRSKASDVSRRSSLSSPTAISLRQLSSQPNHAVSRSTLLTSATIPRRFRSGFAVSTCLTSIVHIPNSYLSIGRPQLYNADCLFT